MKQIKLHKKMLSLLVLPSEKTKKMKDILELQKKINVLKMDLLKILEELDGREKQEQEMVSRIATLREKYTLYQQQQQQQQEKKTPSYRLDKRSKVLIVMGIPNEKDVVLDDIKTFFESFGLISSVNWNTQGSQGQEEEEDDVAVGVAVEEQVEKDAPVLFIHCSTRLVAERIKNEVTHYNELALEFKWYQEKLKSTTTNAVANLKGDGDANCDGIGNNGDNTKNVKEGMEDKSLYYNEDDDLMVDYDYEDEEDA
mmetsp:Transcript_18712/g.21285  ORF Transcript_18712/g.21285 Transcript_18712/m.21285 type:complete len:255 (-) Transcript_18712:651-1415(-)